MYEGQTIFGAFSGLFGVFIFILLIMAVLTPFFIFRIRNELINLNRNVLMLIDVVEKGFPHAGNVRCAECKNVFPATDAHHLDDKVLCPLCWSKSINPR